MRKIPHNHFYSTTYGGLFSSKKLKFKSKSHLENLSIFLDEKIKLVNFNCNKLPKNLINEAKKLLPKTNYIGFSITQGNEYRKKVGLYISLSHLLINLLLKIKFQFFLLKNQEHIIEKIKNQVPGALFPETNSSLLAQL